MNGKRLTIISTLLIMLLIGRAGYSVECRSQSVEELTKLILVHPHTYLAAMEEISTVKQALSESLAVLNKDALAASSELIKQLRLLNEGGLRYAESICYPVTDNENKNLATIFIGVLAALENTDSFTILGRTESEDRTDAEKIKKKAAVIAVRQAAGAIIGGAAGRLVRGGPIGVAIGIFLTPSDLSKRQDPQPPGGTNQGRLGGERSGGFIGDADPGLIGRAGTIAQVEYAAAFSYIGPITGERRAENNQRISAAQTTITQGGH